MLRGLFTCGALALAVATPFRAEDIAVSGRVLVPGGAALPEAEVVLWPLADARSEARDWLDDKRADPVAATLTDEDGRFRLAAPPGLWRVVVRAPGFVDLETTLTPLLEPTELPDASLDTDVGVTVRLTGAAGHRLGGARVRVETDRSRYAFDRPAWEAATRRGRTDEAGTVLLPRGERERVVVTALAAGHALVERRGVAGTSATLQAEAGTRRTLQVAGADGKAVAGAVVIVGGIPAGRASDVGRLELVAARGADTPLELLAGDGRHLVTRLRPAPRPPEAPEVVTLPDLLAIPGRLIDAETRKAISGGIVWDEGNPIDAAVADGGGGFVLRGPHGKRLEIIAGAPGYLPAHVRGVQLLDDGRPGPTLALRPAATLEGTIVDAAGAAIAGADVTLEEKRTPGMLRFEIGGSRRDVRALSSAKGAFRLGPIDPDKDWTVKARAAGYAPGEASVTGLEPYRTRSGIRVRLDAGHVVTGRLVDLDGAPLADAKISLAPAAQPGGGGLVRVMSEAAPAKFEGTSDAAGGFAIRGLPAGRFDFRATRPGFAQRTLPAVEVGESDAPFDLGDIVLEPGERVQGIVTDAAGGPIEGVQVFAREKGAPQVAMVLPGAAAPQQEPDAVTDPGGWFEVADLARDGAFDLSFSRRGYVAGKGVSVTLPRPEPVEVTLQPASDVIGHVRDPEGEPIAGAEVNLSRSHTMEMGGSVMQMVMMESAESDGEGRFVFEDQTPGTISLKAVAAGWQERSLSDLAIPQGEDLTGIVLPLEPGAIIEGRVFTPDGRPAVGASVRPIGDEPRRMGPLGGGATDGNGYFRIEGLAPGPASVEANHDDYPRAVKDLEVEAGVNAIELHFAGGQEVAGRVLDTGGNPVAAALVRLVPEGAFFGGPQGKSAGDGTFALPGVKDGDYRVFADAEGYAALHGAQRVSVAGEPVAGVVVQLDAGTTVVGKVSGVDPVDFAKVSVQAHGAGFLEDGAPVDFEGNFRLAHVAPGSYTIVAQLAGTGRQAREPVTVEAGALEVRVDLQFGGGLTLAGRAVQGDVPIAGALIYAQGVDVDHSGQHETGEDGAFSIEGLAAGTYRVSLQQWRTGLSYREEVEVRTSRTIELRVPTAQVRGTITDGTDRQPLGGVRVTLESDDGASTAWRPTRTGTTDLEGKFILDNVGDGPWRLTATKQGYAAVTQPVTVQFERTVEDLSLAMDPTEGLTIEARLASGATPEELRIAVLDPAGAVLTSGAYATGENGRVRLSSVPPGSWELLVTAAGAAVTSVRAQAPGATVPVALEPACTMVVRVPELARSSQLATVTLHDVQGRQFRAIGWQGVPRGDFSMAEGQLEFRALPPGSWTVRVSSGDGRAWESSGLTSPATPAEVIMQ